MKKDTINKKEIDKFSKLADEWWDPEGKFKPLHNFNPIRLKYIKDTINNTVYSFEPRVLLQDVKVVLSPDENDIRITIKFQVISTEETDTLNVSLTRLR